ncbi:MurR/RpiR family transcriptional regulator [Pontibacillus litoralis]|uniref:RpiR family transcriptional regulator n=1 Tax=Pontibacillus litoralis JSM 072002 TaxID=1385512 RepID=A0A0A5FXV8_9BACI|nr:MurR/RpiR family transcriptional regulator [Pontibacillus litoralis]KGX84624.1 RpiR family transcriptional regulator [Pontibacillus litoralis JSM 072002]
MLKSIQNQLPTSERKIAQYILNNPHEVVSMTVKQLADHSLTSAAAVIRLCKSLDVNGFKELKMRIAVDLQTSKPKSYRDITKNESTKDIIMQMSQNSIYIIEETSELIRSKDIERASELLKKAKAVHLFGVGASGLVAFDAQQKFLRAGLYAFALNDVHLSFTALSNATSEHVAIIISFSGETKEAIEFIKLAKRKGIPTISITKYGTNSLSKLADINLYAASTHEAISRSAATSSRLAQLLVIDILFMTYVSNNFDTVIDALDQSKHAIQNKQSPY